jgi:DNA repair protein RadA/Sms
MSQSGLSEVKNPSELFISERPENSSGSVVVPSIEGTRPILVEIQALVTPTSLSLPRRTAIGLDSNRASILIAVIEKKLGITMSNQDVFLNVAGGVRLNEPGIDLGIITAIVSSKLDQPVPSDTVICGEVGLTGEVRSISQTSVRINEASRLGFTKFILPKNSLKNTRKNQSIKIKGVESISEAMESIFKIK